MNSTVRSLLSVTFVLVTCPCAFLNIVMCCSYYFISSGPCVIRSISLHLVADETHRRVVTFSNGNHSAEYKKSSSGSYSSEELSLILKTNYVFRDAGIYVWSLWYPKFSCCTEAFFWDADKVFAYKAAKGIAFSLLEWRFTRIFLRFCS